MLAAGVLPESVAPDRFAFARPGGDLGSAVLAHLAVGDGPEAWGWAAGTDVLWGLSYFFWRRLQAAPASA